MKKILLMFIAAAGLCAFQVQAEDMDAAMDNNDDEVMTISEAVLLANNSPVMIVGTITEDFGNGKYMLKDDSGETIVIIEEDDWEGMAAKPGNTVHVNGTVNHTDQQNVEIDAISAMVQP